MRMVLVEWLDAASSDALWHSKDDIIHEKPIPCITVGLCLLDAGEDIRVILSASPQNYSQEITIPKSMITRVRTLKINETTKG